MSKKKKSNKKEQHPTLFVLEGAIRLFKDGSMLELHSQITMQEWEMMVSETIHYKVFIECLKAVACPILEEPWTEEDDYFRIQMEIAVSRMRNIDPLLVANFNQEEIMQQYKKKAQRNAQVLKAEINEMKQAQLQLKNDMRDDENTTKVSDL